MEFAGATVDFVLGIAAPVAQCWKYHRDIQENMQDLKSKLEQLKGRKQDIWGELRAQLLLPEKIAKKEVELWMEKVEQVSIEVEGLEEEVKKVKFFSRVQVSRHVVKKSQKVEELLRNGNFSDSLVVNSPCERKFPPVTVFGETTALKNLNEIWAYLMSEDIRKIGLYGMGGSGKTTVMKHVYNKLLKEKNMFDLVIWITASKALDIYRLQLAIAKEMKLDISDSEDLSIRASKLYSLLERKEKYVIVLDDLWETFSLKEIGIPEPTTTNKCKLVVTTRSYDVCVKMDCKKVKMQLLSKNEAGELFFNNIGNDTILSPIVKDIAYQVADECSCLPFALVTIARSMKGKIDPSDWRSTLDELKGIRHNHMEVQVLNQLKLSYNHLKDERLKNCLVFCALYPEDEEINKEELVDNLVNDGIIGRLDCIQAEIDKGHSLLNELQSFCLLEQEIMTDSSTTYVKMHDLIRDMTIHIANENSERFLVKSGEMLTEIPDDDNWAEKLEKASFIGNSIKEITSNAPRCPNLSTLLLRRNYLVSIANSFFMHLRGLIFLDLSYTNISSLPDSLSNLVNLVVLLLRCCGYLTHVPSLEKMRSLKKLDLMCTKLRDIPQGSEMLTNLRYLDLLHTDISNLPIGLLPKMPHLAFLSTMAKLKVKEVDGLKKLEVLRCCLSLYDFCTNFQLLVNRLNKPLFKYCIMIKCREITSTTIIYPSKIALSDKHIELHKLNSRKQRDFLLPNNVSSLVIRECREARSLRDISSFNNMISLEKLSIKQCNNLRDISSFNNINSLEELSIEECDRLECLYLLSSSSLINFPALKSLRLYNLSNLGDLVSPWVISLPVFNHLTDLIIFDCPKLRKLFPYKILRSLQNLQVIEISACESLEEVIYSDGEALKVDPITSTEDAIQTCLPNVEVLDLTHLPELKSICPDGISICDSVHRIIVYGCPKLERIPISLPITENGEPFVPSSLVELTVDQKLWLSLKWDHPNTRDVLDSIRMRHN